jgi:hypothetical protein
MNLEQLRVAIMVEDPLMPQKSSIDSVSWISDYVVCCIFRVKKTLYYIDDA